MSALHTWFNQPIATVRIETTPPWRAKATRTSVGAAGKPPIPPFWNNVLQTMRQPQPGIFERGILGRILAGRRLTQKTRLAVLDRVSLGQKSSLVLVEVDGSRMLVGVGADGSPSIMPLRSPVCSDVRTALRSRLPRRRS